MSDRILIIGAGHDGMTAATLLARAGRPVTLLERRSLIGGLAAAEEFHPGYRSPGVLHDTTGLRPDVVAQLGLEQAGLRMRTSRPDLLLLDAADTPRWLRGETAATVRELASSPADAAGYEQYRNFVEQVRPAFRALFDRAAIDLLEPTKARPLDTLRRLVRVRRLGRTRLAELLRSLALSVADGLDERLTNGPLKAALALEAVHGTFSGPRAPGSMANLLWWETLGGAGCQGGGPALIAALEHAARAAGVEIRTEAHVRAIRCSPTGVSAVELADGETLDASVVLAACDPRHTLLELVARGSIPARLERRMREFRSRAVVAQLLLALTRPPQFAACADPVVEHARTGSCLNDVERAYDAVKYGEIAGEPVLDLHVPTAGRPELAPSGAAVVSVLVHGVPYEPGAGWTDEHREGLVERILARLERHAPGLRSTIAGQRLRTPQDLERDFAIAGGHLFHGETALDQLLVRPAPACIRHATPIPGLYLCGRGTHPAGGIQARSGALAAAAILNRRDQG